MIYKTPSNCARASPDRFYLPGDEILERKEKQ